MMVKCFEWARGWMWWLMCALKYLPIRGDDDQPKSQLLMTDRLAARNNTWFVCAVCCVYRLMRPSNRIHWSYIIYARFRILCFVSECCVFAIYICWACSCAHDLLNAKYVDRIYFIYTSLFCRIHFSVHLFVVMVLRDGDWVQQRAHHSARIEVIPEIDRVADKEY